MISNLTHGIVAPFHRSFHPGIQQQQQQQQQYTTVRKQKYISHKYKSLPQKIYETIK